jgi:hypothetical protein
MPLNKHFTSLLLTGLLLLLPVHTFAYVGPGLGAGTIGVILGLLGSFFLALFAFFWYPIKRALFRKKVKEKDDSEDFAPMKVTADTEGVRETQDQ